MAITRRTDYAIRIVLELAKAGGETPLPAARLAELANVPYEFTRSIAGELVSAGILESTRGAAGGFSLARPAEDITVADILSATEEPPLLNTCVADPAGCQRSGGCPMHTVWLEADDLLREFLRGVDIASVGSRRKVG